MDVYNHVGSGGWVMGGGGEISSSVPTCGVLYDDLLFFMNILNQPCNDLDYSKRYSRIIIILMAFYIESLSNLLLYEIKKINNNQFIAFKKIYKSNKIKISASVVIDNLRIAYGVLKNNPNKFIDFDIRGIRDLFEIRHLFAHPPGRSIISGNILIDGKGLPEDRKPIVYEKFQDFPKIISEFTVEHAKILYNEINIFLKQYCELISMYFPKDFLSSYFSLRELE
jgi:hypothetical protein